jgi:hypothetical protein
MMRIVVVQYGSDDGVYSGAADDACCGNNDDDANDDSCGEKGDNNTAYLSVAIHSLYHSVVRTL